MIKLSRDISTNVEIGALVSHEYHMTNSCPRVFRLRWECPRPTSPRLDSVSTSTTILAGLSRNHQRIFVGKSSRNSPVFPLFSREILGVYYVLCPLNQSNYCTSPVHYIVDWGFPQRTMKLKLSTDRAFEHCPCDHSGAVVHSFHDI